MFANITTLQIAEFISAMVSYIVCFSVTWWMIFLIVIPFSVTVTPLSHQDKFKGHASSAPDCPNIKQKCIITTYITIVVATFIWSLFFFNILSLYSLSEAMVEIIL